MPLVTVRVLREAIGVFFKERFNSDTVEEICVEMGLQPPVPPMMLPSTASALM
ncbi:hypothetical protein GXW82_23305 [Streptacidiphilus sp. 4-A2]|nr:hypothetical protein [Streptacidiphilus sp. 4-A2]